LSNGSSKEVAVKWEPKEIDTSTPGEKEAVGSVVGFDNPIIYKITVEAVGKGIARLTLYKDSTSVNNTIDFVNIKNFYLENKETGKKYNIGSSPSKQKEVFEMKDIPVGEYTIHFDMPVGFSVKEILLGEEYKETKYEPTTNPLTIKNLGSNKNYVKIVVVSENKLKEIKPLNDLRFSVDITFDEFKAAFPNQVTIEDSNGKEHLVDLKWDLRPFNFSSWKKPGEYTVRSEFFKLPVTVSNSDPAERLEVTLKVIFE